MGPDQGRTGHRLKIPAGRFEQFIVDAFVLVQFVLGLGAVLLFAFWTWLVLGSWYHPRLFEDGINWEYFSIDFYPGIFAAAVAFTIPVVLLHYLYEYEDEAE